MNLPSHVESTHKLLLLNLVEKLQTEMESGLLSIVLFGSVARGTADKKSDIDILIIFDHQKVSRKMVRGNFIESRKLVLRQVYKSFWVRISESSRSSAIIDGNMQQKEYCYFNRNTKQNPRNIRRSRRREITGFLCRAFILG